MKTYSKLLEGISYAIKSKMLALPLWGVLDISQMERRYEIIEVIETMMFNDQFKEDGFKVSLIDGNNFVQKVPYFHDDFIMENDLTFNNKPSYTAYLAHMHKKQKDYAKAT